MAIKPNRIVLLLTTTAALAFGVPAHAGPPYLTDDPEPVDYHSWEWINFLERDQTSANTSLAAPAMELNYGGFHNTQLHFGAQYANFSANGQATRGLGDTELAIKYRFVQETKRRPEFTFYPAIEVPTGNESRGLGNGRAFYKLPFWMQKSWGPWTTYGGGGYVYNTAPGMRDSFYGGEVLQRTLNAHWTLGAELFHQCPQMASLPPLGDAAPLASSSWIWNAGGSYNFNPNLALLFSAGHSFRGDRNAVLYLGIDHTWGPDAEH